MSEKLKGWLLSYPVEDREEIVRKYTGSSLPYIMKSVWTAPHGQEPKFKAKIAIGLDKASRGFVDFRELIDGADEIDWAYVRRRLSR